jgi:hypothetical protein
VYLYSAVYGTVLSFKPRRILHDPGLNTVLHCSVRADRVARSCAGGLRRHVEPGYGHALYSTVPNCAVLCRPVYYTVQHCTALCCIAYRAMHHTVLFPIPCSTELRAAQHSTLYRSASCIAPHRKLDRQYCLLRCRS